MPAKRAYLTSDPLTMDDEVPELVIGDATLSPDEWPTGRPTFVVSLEQERHPLIEEWNHAVSDFYRKVQTGGKNK